MPALRSKYSMNYSAYIYWKCIFICAFLFRENYCSRLGNMNLLVGGDQCTRLHRLICENPLNPCHPRAILLRHNIRKFFVMHRTKIVWQKKSSKKKEFLLNYLLHLPKTARMVLPCLFRKKRL